MNGYRRDYDPPSMLDTLFGWMFALIAVSIFLGFIIELVAPLLPWIGALIMLGLGLRYWVYRTSRW